MYKIPGRSIVCDTIPTWIKEMIWVYVVMKAFRTDIEAICPSPVMSPQDGVTYAKGAV